MAADPTSTRLPAADDTGRAEPGSWATWLAARARVRAARGMQRTDNSRGPLMDLASNDYLGLGRHPEVRAAAAAAVQEYGAGAAASRVATGTLPVHRELEGSLCRYTGRAEALVFSSGYTANLGVLGALGGPGSLFILDAHAHASLIDGARLSGALVETSRHNDLEHIERLLRENLRGPAPKPRVAVVVESIYSVLGDAAPLAEAAELCARHGALLVVDEAHSLAATDQGSAVRAAGLAGSGHVVVTATLSKALGAQGGAALLGGESAGLLREHLVNTSRTFLFDTALAPAAAAAALRSLALADPGRIGNLARNAKVICETLAGHPELRGRIEPGAGAVQSIKMPGAAAAMAVTAALREHGIAVACFRPPSVPDGISRLRITAHAHQDPVELALVLGTVARIILEVES
ncbi:aminotransferase class I/II-fold pyridoxal phosphate-dependent enzyme [Paeniglutamicibacter kerguelensis]|uniref:8-amino-7-oxononanoate synthase n=1 Tax=Paeniglutamicibacter kerguelensis TaxID=254788 RepID=A0ABS4XCD6_9MICC|nr:aminotransferase class I/II-fold pyridoxal phosphate-dependent enzyme [Paeniglutamicibacter kerguelensis]MBP2386137.1 8-amino-7-oxononanoate synthase [Paeniglutamicibacter kerguelensis]